MKKLNWKVLYKKASENDLEDLKNIAKKYGFSTGKTVDEIGGMKGPFLEYSNPKRKLKGYATPESFRKLLLKIKAEKAFFYWKREMENAIFDKEIMGYDAYEKVKENYLKAKKFYENVIGKKVKTKIDTLI